MVANRADESGFPRTLGRAPSQKEVAILVGRKQTRLEKAKEGDLVILAVNGNDQLVVEAITPAVVGLLSEIRDQLKELNARLPKELR